MAISVAVPVGNQVADELMERMTPLVKELQVGPPDDKNAAMGEGYFRLSAFNSRENVERAMQRIVKL